MGAYFLLPWVLPGILVSWVLQVGAVSLRA